MTGVAILIAAVVLAAALGLSRRASDGGFGPRARSRQEPQAVGEEDARWRPGELGERATLVQFSSAFCAPCRTTRVVLADVAASESGVLHVELDAEQHLDLVRELDVRRTPTTIVLDAAGREIARAAGAPRREQVLAALPTGAAR